MQKTEYNEIPLHIVKLLSEKKSIEKKNLGTRDLDNFMRQVVDFKSDESICNFIKIFKIQLFDQTGSTNFNANLKKSSFSGFLMISNILKAQEITFTTPIYFLISPLISTFRDSDPKMIVEAANTIIKIIKNQNKVVLRYFNEIFEGLLNLNVNPDQEVRNSANSLDEVMKDILNNCLQAIELINIQNFNVDDLFSKLFEKIRASHPSIKILIVSWITFLDSIPEIKLLNFLPELLPGLFNMLCDKTKDVNQCAEKSLKHFRKEIETDFENLSLNDSAVLNKILVILIDQCKSSHEQARVTSFEWQFIFLQKYFVILSNFYNKNFKIQSSYYTKIRSSIANKNDFFKVDPKNGVNKFSLSDEPLTTVYRNSVTNPSNVNSNLVYVQPDFSFKMSKKDLQNEIDSTFSIDNKTENIQSTIMNRIPFHLFHKILDVILFNVNSQNEQILSLAHSCNLALVKMIDYFSLEITSLNVKQFEEVLKNYFDSKKESTIDLILNWISKLFRKFHDEMFTKVDVFIDSFTNILADSNQNVFNTILDILCEISRYKESYTELILCKLLEKLCINKNLLNSKGLVILKKLCSVLPVTRVYLKFADLLIKIKDTDFIGNMLNILDIFLITYKETEPLRISLKKFQKIAKNDPTCLELPVAREFFEKIFTAWSYNPISTLILCIISEYFELSYYLILKFGELKMEQEYFIQLSQLVQLVESSLFNNIRVLLLEPVKNIYLVKTLYGILMLLPQGKAYQALAKRLKSIEMLLQIDNDIFANTKPKELNHDEIDYFLKIFCNTHLLLKSNK